MRVISHRSGMNVDLPVDGLVVTIDIPNAIDPKDVVFPAFDVLRPTHRNHNTWIDTYAMALQDKALLCSKPRYASPDYFVSCTTDSDSLHSSILNGKANLRLGDQTLRAELDISIAYRRKRSVCHIFISPFHP